MFCLFCLCLELCGAEDCLEDYVPQRWSWVDVSKKCFHSVCVVGFGVFLNRLQEQLLFYVLRQSEKPLINFTRFTFLRIRDFFS